MNDGISVLKADGERVRFPQLCPLCGVADPAASVRFQAGNLLSSWVPLNESSLATWRFEVPACGGCVAPIQRQRFAPVLSATAAFLGGGLFFGAYVLLAKALPAVPDYGLAGGLLVIFAGLCVVLNRWFSPALRIFPYAQRLIFDFKRPDVAQAFRRLNEDLTR
ncbi:MAG: hypothetical protein ACO1RX_14380 [Candidatus Sericytochromatia bacterium]